LSSFTGNLGDGVSRNYTTEMIYTAAGQLAKEALGKPSTGYGGMTTTLYQRFNYNVRQQLFAVRVGTDGNPAYDPNPTSGTFIDQHSAWDRGLLVWHYGSNDYANWGTSGTNNNGNVLRAHHYIPCAGGGNCGVYYSDYDYDDLSRVQKVTDYGLSTNVQQFDYDRWGNRTINQTSTTTSPDINKKLYTVNPTNNRLGVPSGQSGTMTYDAVGNLVTDTYTNPSAGGGMTYNAENRMTSAVNGSHQYQYDAEGKRVTRSIAGQGEFWMVYGIGGELVAEYNAYAAPTAPLKEYGYRNGKMVVIAEGSNPKWLIQDHLGSTRMEIGLSGSLSAVTRHDYLPFGEELGGAVRTAPYGFGAATNTKQKFTGQERDVETGLDFMQARYCSSIQGRFASADPIFYQKEMLVDPQRYNLYGYVRNNPLRFIDPKGEAIQLPDDPKEREIVLEALKKAVGKAGSYLYSNYDKKTGHYFVGILNKGPDGKGPDFKDINGVSRVLGALIEDTRVATVYVAKTGDVAQGFNDKQRFRIGSMSTGTTSPGVTWGSSYGHAKIYVLNPSEDPGNLAADQMSNNTTYKPDFADILIHELGHVAYYWGKITGPSHKSAVALENWSRQLRDPNAPLRIRHNSGGPKVDEGPWSVCLGGCKFPKSDP
jgi:RHS repeat-associated protein